MRLTFLWHIRCDRGDGGDILGATDYPETTGCHSHTRMHLLSWPRRHRKTGHWMVYRQPRHDTERQSGEFMSENRWGSSRKIHPGRLEYRILLSINDILQWIFYLVVVSSLNTMFSSQLLSYSGGRIDKYSDASLSQRLRFIGNPELGDASISLSDIRPSDIATYKCKVKKLPGVDMRKVTLVVMGEDKFPSTGFTCSCSSLSYSSLKCCSNSLGICWTCFPSSQSVMTPFLCIHTSFTPLTLLGWMKALSHYSDNIFHVCCLFIFIFFYQCLHQCQSAGWMAQRREAAPSHSAANPLRDPFLLDICGEEKVEVQCHPLQPKVRQTKEPFFKQTYTVSIVYSHNMHNLNVLFFL